MQQVAVIGAGTMGNGIAHLFAMKGFSVHLVDISATALEQALVTIAANLGRMVGKGTINEADRLATL